MSARNIPQRTRQRVAEAAHYRCGYCLTSQQIVGPLLEIEHIAPEAHGGTDDENNLWLSCPRCNRHKSDRASALDPESELIVPLFNPRTERWAEHFEWIEGGAVIRGKTAIGRATATALQVNQPEMIAARRLWVIAGWHPPSD